MLAIAAAPAHSEPGRGRVGDSAVLRWRHCVMVMCSVSGKLMYVTVHVKIHDFPLFNCLPLPYLFCSFYDSPPPSHLLQTLTKSRNRNTILMLYL